MLRPSQDVDFSVLDIELLKPLAWRWDMSRMLEDWMKRVNSFGATPRALEQLLLSSGSEGGFSAVDSTTGDVHSTTPPVALATGRSRS